VGMGTAGKYTSDAHLRDACDTCRNFPEFSLIIGGICFGGCFERNLLEFANNLVTNSGIFYV